MILYDHQREALDRMRNGCILCGGVGSGKSRTALAYYYICNGGKKEVLTGGDYYPMNDPPKDLYIITTARKRDTLEWEDELSHFLLSTDGKVNIYANKVVVDSWNNIKKYADAKNSFFIFDEQRVIGNGTWVKAFLKIAKENEWILLSATPGDTWMDYIPVFIANGYYRNRTDFIRQHVVYSRSSKYPKVDHFLNTGKLIQLKRRLLVTMEFERPTVSHNIDVLCSYDISKYKETQRTRWDSYKGEPVENAAYLCYIFRRIVNEDESRIEHVREIVQERKKVIIFYTFDYERDLLKKAKYGKGYQIAEWNGHKHEPIPDGDKWVYLVQYTAGAEGWNCISTDTIIFYSQSYSYKIMVQAKGRIDRLNTPFKDLHYYYLKSKAPIDIAIARAIKNKKQFNETQFIRGL